MDAVIEVHEAKMQLWRDNETATRDGQVATLWARIEYMERWRAALVKGYAVMAIPLSMLVIWAVTR